MTNKESQFPVSTGYLHPYIERFISLPRQNCDNHAWLTASLLRTRPNGIAIFPGVCAGFTPVVQVLSRLNQPNFQLYVENIIFPAAHQHTVILTLYNNLYETLARHSTIISVNSCQICKILCYLEKSLSCVRMALYCECFCLIRNYLFKSIFKSKHFWKIWLYLNVMCSLNLLGALTLSCEVLALSWGTLWIPAI